MIRVFEIIFQFILLTFFWVACANPEKPAKSMTTNFTNTTKNAYSATSNSDWVTDTATFGTGCFWCTEAIFQKLEGVLKVTSGYSGGHVQNPTYEQVCEKNTGHAEVIQIVFDPSKITYDGLLEVFWKTHDPTTLNKQGNDIGPQYRSVIFFHNQQQQQKSEYFKEQLNKSGAFDNPIVTAIEPYTNFYSAENYHQNYYNNNKAQSYCYFIIKPKLEKFEKAFKDKFRKN